MLAAGGLMHSPATGLSGYLHTCAHTCAEMKIKFLMAFRFWFDVFECVACTYVRLPSTHSARGG